MTRTLAFGMAGCQSFSECWGSGNCLHVALVRPIHQATRPGALQRAAVDRLMPGGSSTTTAFLKSLSISPMTSFLQVCQNRRGGQPRSILLSCSYNCGAPSTWLHPSWTAGRTSYSTSIKSASSAMRFDVAAINATGSPTNVHGGPERFCAGIPLISQRGIFHRS